MPVIKAVPVTLRLETKHFSKNRRNLDLLNFSILKDVQQETLGQRTFFDYLIESFPYLDKEQEQTIHVYKNRKYVLTVSNVWTNKKYKFLSQL